MCLECYCCERATFGRAERDQRCRKIEAIRHYRTATHEDLSTAKAVVDAIREELPR